MLLIIMKQLMLNGLANELGNFNFAFNHDKKIIKYVNG